MATMNKLVPGLVLYQVVRRKMGNTTLSTDATFPVRVISVDLMKRRVLASWNGNPPRLYTERQVLRWRRTPPKKKTLAGG